MKNKTLQTILIFFVFGVISSFLSLIIMILLPQKIASNESIFSISFLALLEEVVKFSLLYFILSTHSLNAFRKSSRLFLFPVFLGLGFGFFELSLVLFGGTNFPLEMKAFFPMIIHITSAILLTFAINILNKHVSRVYALMFFLLAVFIHICYNVTIVKII